MRVIDYFFNINFKEESFKKNKIKNIYRSSNYLNYYLN